MRKSLRITPLAGLILMVVQPALHAKNWCTNADLVGSYGLFATGAIVLPDKTPITGPFARVGRTTFDGNGNLSNLTVASYNGNIFNEPYNGTYTVNSDCTVTFIANLSAPVNAPVTLSGVLSDNNNEVRFMLTNQQVRCRAEEVTGPLTAGTTQVMISTVRPACALRLLPLA